VWTRRRRRARRARRRPRRGSPVPLVYRLYQRYTSGPQGPARVQGRAACRYESAGRGPHRRAAAEAAGRPPRAPRGDVHPDAHARSGRGCEVLPGIVAARRSGRVRGGVGLRSRSPAARGACAPPLWRARRCRQTGPGGGVSRWRPASNGYSRAGVYLDDDWRSSQRAGRRSPEGSVDAPWGIGGPEARPPSSRAGARPGRVE
jgi:hypothetical protein